MRTVFELDIQIRAGRYDIFEISNIEDIKNIIFLINRYFS